MEILCEDFQNAYECLHEGKLEEAETLFLLLVEAQPKFAEANNMLGVVLKDRGKLEEAIHFHKRAVSIKPDYVEAHYKLGIALRDADHIDEAVASCSRALKLDPEYFPAKHMLFALSGKTTDCAPTEYVTHLFDNFSKRFDKHSEGLGYNVPMVLRKMLDGVVGMDFIFQNAIDLGCGTGISGKAIRSATKQMSGVDLSSSMVEEAENKAIYDKLLVDSVESFLTKTREQYDLFICTDVFVYIGDLTTVFNLVRERALSGAYFAFSIENTDEADFILQKSGRYAQSVSYIQTLATANHFVVESQQYEILRKDKGKPIFGSLYILKYTK